MYEELTFVQNLASEINQVSMVGEEEDLRAIGKVSEGFEGG